MGWVSILSKVIPWGDVIDAAPQIVKGAKRLFRSTGSNTDAPDPSSTEDAKSLADFNARMRQLQTKIAELQTEQQASAALIQSLAEQNERVVAAVEVLRTRMKLLIYACATMAVALVAIVTWVAKYS